MRETDREREREDKETKRRNESFIPRVSRRLHCCWVRFVLPGFPGFPGFPGDRNMLILSRQSLVLLCGAG